MTVDDTLSASRSRRRPWSLYIVIAWAAFLAFYTGVYLWDLTGPLAQYGTPNTVIGWLSLVTAFLAPFAFGASVYGLWGLRPWGRYLFLAISTLFFGLNLISIWLPGGVPPNLQDPAQVRNAQLLALARNGLALFIPLIYFNLSWVKALFEESTDQQVDESANEQISKSESQLISEMADTDPAASVDSPNSDPADRSD
jgi:membrane protease YdiL (CAAX protease family)